MTSMFRLSLALAATVALGLASRLYPIGWHFYDRVLGEVLYAVAAYLAFAVLFRSRSPRFIAFVAFASCVVVEFFKLTGYPAENQHLFLVRWFLGMKFSLVNIGYYFIGAVLGAVADSVTRGQPHAGVPGAGPTSFATASRRPSS